MYVAVFWIHMPFCIKNNVLQDYASIYPTIFPFLIPVTQLLFVCMYTMIFIFSFCCSKRCILGLLHEKERKRTLSFPAIELNERSDTCLTYFPYPCKSNSAAPLSWETERYSLIYTDVKRSQIFAQFNWFWADRNWFILHNSKLLKANVFFIKNEKWYWAKDKNSKKLQQMIRKTGDWENVLLSGKDLQDLVFSVPFAKQYRNHEIAKKILKGDNSWDNR